MNTSNKDKYGEVLTPPTLVHAMIDDAIRFMGPSFFSVNAVFEPGAGKGAFYRALVLDRNSLLHKDTKYTMNEINPQHKGTLLPLMRPQDSLFLHDLLTLPISKSKPKADIVWGNLPFHNGGKCFVPGLASAKNQKQKQNIVTIWPKMIHFVFQHILKDKGFFYAIIPCIWLKEDRARIYDLFVRKHKLCFLKVFDCVTANAIFGYQCQTPICYVMVQKTEENVHTEHVSNNMSSFHLYDSDVQDYIPFQLHHGMCIPTNHASIFQKAALQIFQKKTNHIPVVTCDSVVKKISLLKDDIIRNTLQTFDQKNTAPGRYLEDYAGPHYKIITGASIRKKEKNLVLHGMVSTLPGLYAGIPKLILPHKRLPRFFKDYDGSFSCYGRDMYVFLCPNGKEQLDTLDTYLTSPTISAMIGSGFTIRMNFIEKYVFQYIEYPMECI